MTTDATLQDFMDYCKSGETEIYSTSFLQILQLFAANFPVVTGTESSAELADFVNFSKDDDTALYTTTWQQIANLIAPTSLTINDQSGETAYTLAATDNGCVIIFDDASDITLTIPQQSNVELPVGFNCLIRNVGVGKVTLDVQGSDVLVGNGFVDGAVNSATIVLRKTVSTVNTFDVYGGNAT
jgi:hypothetical protein